MGFLSPTLPPQTGSTHTQESSLGAMRSEHAPRAQERLFYGPCICIIFPRELGAGSQVFGGIPHAQQLWMKIFLIHLSWTLNWSPKGLVLGCEPTLLRVGWTLAKKTHLEMKADGQALAPPAAHLRCPRPSLVTTGKEAPSQLCPLRARDSSAEMVSTQIPGPAREV